jgi:hypothetical protein
VERAWCFSDPAVTKRLTRLDAFVENGAAKETTDCEGAAVMPHWLGHPGAAVQTVPVVWCEWALRQQAWPVLQHAFNDSGATSANTGAANEREKHRSSSAETILRGKRMRFVRENLKRTYGNSRASGSRLSIR